jgi:hypothetical protein
MEVIVPLLTLGGVGLYINEKKKVGEIKKINLPNKTILPHKEIQSQYKDIDYKTNQEKNVCSQSNSIPGKFTSISGETVDSNHFNHNNMKPFFGSKVKQASVKDSSYLMDNMQGSGSEHIAKKEQETLFKPVKNLGWNNGTPSTSDFVQSRMNPGVSKNNTKPWEEVRVGPGLNQGYGTEGSNGFNSALESRGDWIDKDVDELRTFNNPKVTYDGVTLGGKHNVTNRGIEGRVEQHKPDTYYKNSQDRYLTTTGSHIAPKAQSEQMMGNTTRNETSTEYYGAKSHENGGSYVSGKYNPGFKQQLKKQQIGVARGGQHTITDNKTSYNFVPNARTTTEENKFFGTLVGIAKEVIMPIRETIRPSKKENVIGNLNSVGNVGVRANHYVKNTDTPRTTTKETTCSNERLANIGNTNNPGTGYLTSSNTPVNTQRTTTTQSYFGPSGNTQKANNSSVYGAYYNGQTNTNKEEVSVSRTNMGNIQLFNNNCNVQGTKREHTQNYAPAPNSYTNTPDAQTHGMMSSRDPVKQDDRLGGYLVDTLNNNPYNLSVSGK